MFHYENAAMKRFSVTEGEVLFVVKNANCLLTQNITNMTIDNQPWVEKYRPSTLEQVAGQEETVKVLSKSIQSMNVYLFVD
jgi:hypothetical protein